MIDPMIEHNSPLTKSRQQKAISKLAILKLGVCCSEDCKCPSLLFGSLLRAQFYSSVIRSQIKLLFISHSVHALWFSRGLEDNAETRKRWYHLTSLHCIWWNKEGNEETIRKLTWFKLASIFKVLYLPTSPLTQVWVTRFMDVMRAYIFLIAPTIN